MRALPILFPIRKVVNLCHGLVCRYLTFKSRQKSSATKPTDAMSKEAEPPKEPTKVPSKETTRLVS